MKTRVACEVLCCFLTISTVIAAKPRTKKECDPNNYSQYTATINHGYKPYWFQMYFKRCLQGDRVPELSVYTLSIQKNSALIEVSNFPLLKVLYFDNNNMNKMPEFINLPKLDKLSISSNKLKSIPSIVISGTPVKELIFSRNQIETIGKGAFGMNVEEILLTCNNISILSPTWFQNPAGILVLGLGGNKIQEIPPNMFKDFVNLKRLELRNNQIVTLGAGSISGPHQMLTLHLGYNNISEIKPEVFGQTLNVTYFNVEYNRLSFLHQAMMDKIISKEIIIWGNPWQCPCQTMINNWIVKNNEDFSQGLPRDEDPVCVTALSFRDTCIPYVDNDLYETFLMTFEISPFNFCLS